MMTHIQNCIDGLVNRLKSIVKVSTLVTVDDSGSRRLGSFAYLGRTVGGMVHMPYGLFGNPPEGAFVLTFAMQGQESNLIGIADDPANRPVRDTSPGEIGLGNYTSGSYMLFREDGSVLVNAPSVTFQTGESTSVTIDASGVTVVGGDVISDGTSLETHVHSGVTAGGANTGPPV